MILAFLSVSTFYSSASASFSSPVNISGAKISYAPSIASSGSTVYVAYPQAASPGIQLYSDTIANDGTTLGTPTMLSSGSNNTNNFPRNAAVGNFVYVTWQYVTSSNCCESIMFRASSDAGSTWGPLINISQIARTEVTCAGNTGAGLCAQPTIAAEGNNVYVSWTQQAGTSTNVWIAVSNNNGVSFKKPIDIGTAKGSHEQEMVAWGSNVAVAFDSGNVFVSVSHDSGATFSKSLALGVGGRAREPHIAASGSDVYLTWEGNNSTSTKYEAWVVASTNNGTNFGPAVDLSVNNGGGAWLPQIAASGSSAYV